MAFSYGYNRAERIEDYKTGRELILILVDLVSRGGNLLLDIGPAADGTIPPIMEERLLELGDWLKVNGEAIHGTRHAGRSCQWTPGTRPTQATGQYQVAYSILEHIGQEPRQGEAVKQVFFTRKPDALYAISAGWPGSEGQGMDRGRRRSIAGARPCLGSRTWRQSPVGRLLAVQGCFPSTHPPSKCHDYALGRGQRAAGKAGISEISIARK
jgi:hypothetical protein